MVPIVVGALAGAAVAGLAVYYFVSNAGNASRTELIQKMEATFKALLEKAEKLKQAKEEAERASQEASADAQRWRTRHEELEKELAETLKEKDDLASELKRWRECDGSVTSGTAVIWHSLVLSGAHYSHKKAITNLEARLKQIEASTRQFDNQLLGYSGKLAEEAAMGRT